MLTRIFLLLFLIGTTPPMAAKLTVEITNVARTGGNIRVALYKPTDKFGTAKPDFFKVIPVEKPGARQAVFDVEPGRYAVAVFHDVNDNDKLDKNLVGYPKEPFGFSNNFRPVVSAPDFDDCAFVLPENGTKISIKLID
jgi:uncharacterized protein (DUF2141 family)